MSPRDIAVVGMACVFPEAADLRSYWRNIVNGVDAIRTLPAERWPGSRNTELPPDHFAHIGSTRGGFIPTPFLFEPLRFKVMPKVARDGDVDQFILLQILGDALADAGIGPGHPLRERADIIVGRGGYTSNKMMEIFLRADLIDRLQRYLAHRLPQLRPADLEALVEDMKGALPEADVDGMATSIPNLVASRAANRLDLQGTAYTVDAACASSLIAVEQGMRRLREGLCDVALACGVNFTHVPSFWYLFGQILAVSPSGRIRPFDRNADGMLIGEGAGAVVLKRLEDAIRDGDHVYALVKGAGSASDGGDTGLLAPSSRGQIKALKMGHADAGVEPVTIGLLEAHGTGTVQGDTCELESIRAVFGERTCGHATRVIGSVKSMIGHTMPAAGIASFIKATLALTNKILPPSLHCDEPHPGMEGLPFFASPTARPWVQPTDDPPRRAGINAFGFGGINSHVVLEEVRPQERNADRRAILATPGMVVESGEQPSSASEEGVSTDGGELSDGARGEVTTGEPGPAGPAEELAAVILEPPTPAGEHDGVLAREPEPSLRRPSELLVFSAPSVPDLAAEVRRAAAFAQADRTGHTLEDLAFSLATEMDGDLLCRLAVVVEEENGAGVAGRLEDLAGKLGEGEIETDDTRGIFFSTEAQRPAGKLAALFPGLGFPGLVGHYPDHLTTLCLHLPAARSVFDQVEARDRHPEDPLPTSFLLQPPAHLPAEERNLFRQRFTVTLRDPDEPVEKMDPARRYLSGVGMLASNWAGWQILERLDLPVDMLCGQSLGDISAMCAAHMVDFEEVIPRLWNYLDEDYRLPGTGCMAFVGASEERIARYLERFDDVRVALHQSPETLVLGGSDESIITLVRLLKAENILAQRLPIPPVHTPRMDHKQQEFVEKEGSPVPLRRPRTTVYSPITSRPMPDDAGEYRALIASNMTQPVLFWQTLRQMYDDGARIFIQVGTGTLAGNIRSILPEEDVTTVALDVDYRHPLTQLQHLCGRLLASGVKLDPAGLFEARRPRRLDLDAPGAEAGKPRGAIPLTLYWPPLHTDEGPLRTGERLASTTESPARPREGESQPGAGQEATLPFVGEVTEFIPQQRIDFVRRFRLDEDLYLEDHHFINCREHKPLEDCFPVVPLTVTLETLAEAAACLGPGTGLIGFEEIRAKRWIALDGVDHLDVRVRAEVVSVEDGIICVRGEVFTGETAVAQAVVRMSSRYRQTVDLRFSELANPRPLALETRRLYDDRHLFHGRRFQCIETITQRGDQGITGELVVPDYGDFLRSTSTPQLLLDPVVLDGAGQMLCPLFVGQAIYMLPVAVEKIEFYRPVPPPGTRVPVRLEVVELDPDQRKLVANMEVQDGEGGVWFRVIGWQDIVFRYPRPLLETQQHPTETTIAREPALSGLPDGGLAVALQRDDLRDAQPERLAQLYLNRDEMDPFRSLAGEPRRQRQWLMGRIAAKDAVRLWLARTSGEPMLHPVQCTIGNDERGRPFVRIPDDAGSTPSGSGSRPGASPDGTSISDAPGSVSRQAPAISMSHTAAIAVAVASPGPAGIDVEAVDAGSRLTLEDFAADSEIALLAEAGGGGIQAAWVTRLWCAKEAAAKLLGGGLQGRPKAIQIIRIEPGGRLLMRTDDSPGTIEVHSSEIDGSLIAVARPAPQVTQDRAADEAHLS